MTALSQRSGVTQLEFHQAMNDFKTMFPEMDEDVIEVVLRANNGAVDATIDQLLAMNLDSENERLRAELDATDNNEVPPRYSPATPPPSYHSLHSQAVPAIASPNRRTQPNGCESIQRTNNLLPTITTMTAFNTNSSNSPSKDSMRFRRKWNPPILGQLPNNFLRIEPDENQRKLASTIVRPKREVTVLNSAMLQQRMEENQRQRQLSNSADDPELSQYLEDERVAIFLQNEEFVRELRRNKDFMSTLELDTASDLSNANSLPEGPSVATAHSDSDAAFKETLKHMGKVSRRKFAQLARLFSGKRRRSFQHLLSNEGNNPSRDNLLIREDEYTQLQNEGSDNEEVMRENQLDIRMSPKDHHENPNITNNSSDPLNSTLRSIHKN